MELFNSPLFIVEDKELALQMLKINNVQAIEITNLNDDCSYPIIGRMFGHHAGQDITIVHSKEQTQEKGFDYYTKLYVIEQEYRLEVLGLEVVNVQEAIVHKVKSHEIPIRTESNGWRWMNADISGIPEEWLDLAIRAVYITGLNHAHVKIGKLVNERPIVIDINSLPGSEIKFEETPNNSFTLGADIEFMLSCDGELLPASEFFPLEGSIGCDERQIEQDSGEYALAEIRPEQSESPHDLFQNIQALITEASNNIPYDNISLHAGSMPFFGYQCGGHLHFGVKPTVHLLRVLDYFLALPLAMIEQSSTSRRRRQTKHGGLGRIREKPYGFEYLSLSSWIVEPEITLAILCLAKLVTPHCLKLKTDNLFHPLTQRAYYQGNHSFLKHLWNDIKTQIMNNSDYFLYEKEIAPLFTYIEEKRLLKDSNDIRQNWKLTIPHHSYERGFIIHVPKKTRMKFNLTEGQETFVIAGKSMSKATIRPYPFSFRNSNIIQLSTKLREILSLPKEWRPKISSTNGALILGPILGILADRPFERQGTYFQHISRIAKQKQMLVYVFEPKDIIWDKQLIKGTTMDGEGVFPFPAVIYDRYIRIQKKQNQEMQEIRAKLEFVYQIPFINSPKLFDLTRNKWLTHQLLKEAYGEFLPDTRIFRQPSDIKDMLNRYGEIFIKPLSGALGKGIIRVVQNASGIFWMNSQQQIYQPLHEIDELATKIQSNTYILQEAVKIKQLNGNFIELRVYMQKNGQKKWVRTGMVARLTNEGVMTAETEMNKRSSEVLNKMYRNPNDQRKIKNQIAKVTRRIVETIEDAVGDFGELAVDVCIDPFDKIKILEVNAKPDNLFSQVNAYKLRNLAAHRLLNYATALSGYVWDETDEKEEYFE